MAGAVGAFAPARAASRSGPDAADGDAVDPPLERTWPGDRSPGQRRRPASQLRRTAATRLRAREARPRSLGVPADAAGRPGADGDQRAGSPPLRRPPDLLLPAAHGPRRSALPD